MAEERTDAMKAINASLSPPEDDLRQQGRDYPTGGGQQVSADSGGAHQPPGYAAPIGRDIDPDADPAAPPGATAHPGSTTMPATDLDEAARPAPANGASDTAAAQDPDAAI